MDVLIDPDDVVVDNHDEEVEILPKWAYGAIAGGLAFVAGVAVTIGHFVSRKRRQKLAEEDARQLNEQFLADEKGTPRDVAKSPVDLNDL